MKINPNPKPDDDPKIVETLGKPILATRIPNNLKTIRKRLLEINRDLWEHNAPARRTRSSRARRDEAPLAHVPHPSGGRWRS